MQIFTLDGISANVNILTMARDRRSHPVLRLASITTSHVNSHTYPAPLHPRALAHTVTLPEDGPSELPLAEPWLSGAASHVPSSFTLP